MNKYYRRVDAVGEIPATLEDMFKYEPGWAISRFRHMETQVAEQDAKIKQYEQIITHLWSWLPIKTRTTYSNDYPPHAKIIGQIRGNDEI